MTKSRILTTTVILASCSTLWAHSSTIGQASAHIGFGSNQSVSSTSEAYAEGGVASGTGTIIAEGGYAEANSHASTGGAVPSPCPTPTPDPDPCPPVPNPCPRPTPRPRPCPPQPCGTVGNCTSICLPQHSPSMGMFIHTRIHLGFGAPRLGMGMSLGIIHLP